MTRWWLLLLVLSLLLPGCATVRPARPDLARLYESNSTDSEQPPVILIHGLMDDNVPPSSTLLVVDALIKANKDFDLLLLPNARHGYGEYSPYVMRKRWDYFVEHLLGAEHPVEYAVKPAR